MSFNRFRNVDQREILIFSAPIVLSMVIQNFMGVFDNALAGFVGTEALAAYGISFFLLFIHAAPLMGLATAVQTLTAIAFGRGEKEKAASFLWAASAVSLGFGALVLVLGHFYIESLLSKMTSDSGVLLLASGYLKARFAGVFAIGINHAFRGYWNGLGKPKLFLLVMSSSYVLNACLSYVLITGRFGFPQMGFLGLGIGSTVSTILAAAANFLLAHFHSQSFRLSKQSFNGDVWRKLFGQSVPSAVQQLLFALSFAILFAIIGRLGAPSLAAANVLVSISLFLIYPAMAMGMTASTFVSRSIGAADGRERFWVNNVNLLSVLGFGFIALALIICRNEVLGVFIHDPGVRKLAEFPLLLFLVTLVIEVAGQVFTFALLGAGRPGFVLAVTMGIQWLVILPLCYVFGSDLNAIWTIQTAARCLQALVLMGIWQTVTLKRS